MVSPAVAVPLVEAVPFLVDAGGAESNVAAHVAALGHSVRWFSRLGDDALGHRIHSQLAKRGIDVSTVLFDSSHRTGLYVKDPGRGVHYYRDGSAASKLSVSDADALDLDEVAVVHITGITAALTGSAPEFLNRLIERAQAAGVPVSFDVNHRPVLWGIEAASQALRDLASRADIVFVGRDEAELLWGTATPADIRSRFEETAELVIKDAGIGATVYHGESEVFVPAQKVEVVEAVGAGDAFAGGYLAAWLSGASIVDRIRAGHARAALTLQTTGDSVADYNS